MFSKIRAQARVAQALLAGLTVAAAVSSLALLISPAVGEEPAPQAFDTPEAAAQALIAASEKNDDAALKALVGPGSEDLIQAGTDVTVQAERAAFAAAAKEKLSIERPEDGRAVLVIGANEWPFPIPVVAGPDGKWHFDAAAGREEILARRIGKNELEAIAICKAYAQAQVAYARVDRDDDKVREYAQRIVSTEGQKDGLYWPAPEGSDEEMSPLGPAVAPFEQYRSETGAPAPFNGYYWGILKAQGPNAPGGAHAYVINGNMIAGFALIGVPAEYMKTGVMTFLVSHHGRVLQKDLGETTLELAKAIETYDPDDSWTDVTDEGESPAAD